MKTIFLIPIIALISTACDKNENHVLKYDTIVLNAYVMNNFTDDAKQIYFDEIFHDSTHVNYNNPILDSNEIIKILKLIQTVYNSDAPERDTVFELYQIHGFYCYSFHSISLKVQTELPEIQNLANGIIPTGETELDNLLATYDFDSVKTFYGYPGFPWLTIYTKVEYYMIPIEKSFNDLPSVVIAEFNKGCVGDGNTITIERTNSSATVTFSIGQGDCPAGCIYHKYWEFRVEGATATFVRSYTN